MTDQIKQLAEAVHSRDARIEVLETENRELKAHTGCLFARIEADAKVREEMGVLGMDCNTCGGHGVIALWLSEPTNRKA